MFQYSMHAYQETDKMVGIALTVQFVNALAIHDGSQNSVSLCSD